MSDVSPDSKKAIGAIIDLKPKRRGRCYLIDPEIFPQIFRSGNAIDIIEGIPDGAQFRGYSIDPARNIICMFVEDPSFAEIGAGERLPEFIIKMGRRK